MIVRKQLCPVVPGGKSLVVVSLLLVKVAEQEIRLSVLGSLLRQRFLLPHEGLKVFDRLRLLAEKRRPKGRGYRLAEPSVPMMVVPGQRRVEGLVRLHGPNTLLEIAYRVEFLQVGRALLYLQIGVVGICTGKLLDSRYRFIEEFGRTKLPPNRLLFFPGCGGIR